MESEERLANLTAHVSPHLSDDQLMESYVLDGENRHLTVCRQCKVRFDDLARALERIREDALREADDVFNAERLHAQRDRVMRRLERHGHPADVVMFPSRAVGHPAVRIFGPARRWVAAAAAAGLAAGMFLGFEMDRRAPRADIGPAAQASETADAWQAAMARDDQFFIEIDDALMRGRAIELRAIDAMTTPVEIREVSYPR
jgi:hypothetical protein